jgi:NAD(P)H-hydrate repair Nnr-like enzyme with NAD(P)H-hydrate epimerase domain
MACARILHLRGFTNVRMVTLVDPHAMGDDVVRLLRPNIREQLDLFSHFVGTSNIHVMDWDAIKNHQGILVDGILGTGIADPPRGVARQAIEAMRQALTSQHNVRTLSIAVPSGLNHITGEAPGICVKATWTCNLHMLKSGQLAPEAQEYVGELWSVESALGFITFPEPAKFKAFYKDGPIRKVQVKD